MRKLWSDFQAGERPFWDNGKIGSPQYQLGFDNAENCIFEDGIVRKRLGVHQITKIASGGAHTPSNEPFIPGYGAYAWDKTGYYSFKGSGTRAEATDYDYTPVTFSPAITTPSWAINELVGYRDASANDVIQAYSAGGNTPYTNKGEFAVEAGGRRILARQLLGSPVVATSLVASQKYLIVTIGSTNFTACGASANTVGVEFIASAVGTGTGTAIAIPNKKIEFHTSQPGDVDAWEYQDGNAGLTTLYTTDPIDLNIGGIGTIMWVSEGFGLFVGTTRGVYEIVSGYGPGFSPYSGGFYAQSLGNVGTMSVAHSTSRVRNQHVTMTQECVCFVCDVDTIAVFNRQAKSIQKIKLDVPSTHAIDSMAWLGGNILSVLLAEISPRLTWGEAAYNAANNIVMIVNEQNGVVSRLTGLSAFTVDGCGGFGLVFKSSNGATIKAGAIPYRSLERYASSPAAFNVDGFYDYVSPTPYTFKLISMPLNFTQSSGGQGDIGDERRSTRCVVRVNNTRSLSVGIVGQTPVSWVYEKAEPALFSGDVEFDISAANEKYSQLEITDNSVFPVEILAIQLDVDVASYGNEQG